MAQDTPLGRFVPALRYGAARVNTESGEVYNVFGRLTTGGTVTFSGSFSTTLTLTAATTVTLPTSGVVLSTANSGTALLAWPALSPNLAGRSGTLTVTGLDLDSVVVVSRQEDNTNGIAVSSAFISAADSLHVVFVNATAGTISAGTATISYIRATP